MKIMKVKDIYMQIICKYVQYIQSSYIIFSKHSLRNVFRINIDSKKKKRIYKNLHHICCIYPFCTHFRLFLYNILHPIYIIMINVCVWGNIYVDLWI